MGQGFGSGSEDTAEPRAGCSMKTNFAILSFEWGQRHMHVFRGSDLSWKDRICVEVLGMCVRPSCR